MDRNFLLDTAVAEKLYHDVAKNLPIIDYHNHLPLEDLVANRKYGNITELWLASDPYKHRAMRVLGVDEKYITGDADDYQKFSEWCRVFPLLVGNALYHWSVCELSWYFGIDLAINSENCRKIWDSVNGQLEKEECYALNLFRRTRVEYSAPCVGLLDDLSCFAEVSELCPSLRADTIYNITPEFVKALEKKTGKTIGGLEELEDSLSVCLDAFDRAGCCFPDTALDAGFYYFQDDGKNEERFRNMLNGSICDEDYRRLQSQLLRMLACQYSRLKWIMQLHVGALRRTSTRLRKIAGAAGGYAGIGSTMSIESIVLLLDDLDRIGSLPKTQIYTLNPNDHAVISCLVGSFSESGVCAKVTEGPAWWWCDHYQGIREMLEYYTYYGVLSTFSGMTTDSRSILSMLRHDYFRRVACQWIGEKVKSGEFPEDYEVLGTIVRRICYENAADMMRNREK